MRQKRVLYSPEVAERVCEAWAAGESLRGMSQLEGMPNPCTVRDWARNKPEFRAIWEEARARRAALFEREPGLAKRAAGHLGPRPEIDEAAAARICARIAAGESLRAIAMDRSLPSIRTIYNWLAVNADFRTAYKAACDVRTDGLIEEALEIADDDSGDLIERPDGRLAGNPQAVSRARVQVEARRWAARLMQTRTDWMDGRLRAGAEAQAEAEEAFCYEDLLDDLLREEAAAKAREAAVEGDE